MVMHDNEFETKEKKTSLNLNISTPDCMEDCTLCFNIKAHAIFQMPTDSISSCQCPGRYGRDETKRTRTRINPFIKRIAIIHESKGRIRQKDYTLKELRLYAYDMRLSDCLEFRKTLTNTSFFCLVFFMNTCALISAGKKTVLT